MRNLLARRTRAFDGFRLGQTLQPSLRLGAKHDRASADLDRDKRTCSDVRVNRRPAQARHIAQAANGVSERLDSLVG